MRFHQLEVGAQFEFQGRQYTKSTSLIAVKQDGSQKFMQRSAVVKPLGAHDIKSSESTVQGSVDIEAVRQAHEKFHQTCVAAIKNSSLNKKELDELIRTFSEANNQFFSEINSN